MTDLERALAAGAKPADETDLQRAIREGAKPVQPQVPAPVAPQAPQESAGRSFALQATNVFGAGPVISGVLRKLTEGIPYAQGRDEYQAQIDAAKQQHPTASTIGSVASLIPETVLGGAAGKAVGAGAKALGVARTFANPVVDAAVHGAVAGAGYGAATQAGSAASHGEDVLPAAGVGALGGAALGGVLGAAGGKIAQVAGRGAPAVAAAAAPAEVDPLIAQLRTILDNPKTSALSRKAAQDALDRLPQAAPPPVAPAPSPAAKAAVAAPSVALGILKGHELIGALTKAATGDFTGAGFDVAKAAALHVLPKVAAKAQAGAGAVGDLLAREAARGNPKALALIKAVAAAQRVGPAAGGPVGTVTASTLGAQ